MYVCINEGAAEKTLAQPSKELPREGSQTQKA